MSEEFDRLIRKIRDDHSTRELAIRMRIRIQNGCMARARSLLGFKIKLPEKERAAIRNLAAKYMSAMTKGKVPKDVDARFVELMKPVLTASVGSSAAWDALAAACEKKMIEGAGQLPVTEFVDSVRGFGLTGLAMIIGEAGDLGNYANPAKLWKRMCLAVIDGVSQRKATDPEVAARMGYNPRRRAVMYRVGDSMIKGNKDGYRELYDSRKAMELERLPADEKGRKMHAHRRAQRYIEKRLLRDLWRAWRGHATSDAQ
ncbi:MAG TPA: hypothetical protein VM223_24770 [Planctomycetota bacterium]|nr:hypothetical protein [Planctomycetota bacterium]